MANLKVPTRGAELAREAGAERYATSVAAAQAAGAEGVIGLLPKLEQQQARQDLAIAAQLEQAEAQTDLARARGAQQAENANVAAARQLGMMRLQGAATAAAEGRRRQQAGLQSAIGGLGQAAALGLKYAPLYGKSEEDIDKSLAGTQATQQAAQQQAAAQQQQQLAQQQQGGFIGPMAAKQTYNPLSLNQQQGYMMSDEYDPVFNPGEGVPFLPLYQGLSRTGPIADPTGRQEYIDSGFVLPEGSKSFFDNPFTI